MTSAAMHIKTLKNLLTSQRERRSVTSLVVFAGSGLVTCDDLPLSEALVRAAGPDVDEAGFDEWWTAQPRATRTTFLAEIEARTRPTAALIALAELVVAGLLPRVVSMSVDGALENIVRKTIRPTVCADHEELREVRQSFQDNGLPCVIYQPFGTIFDRGVALTQAERRQRLDSVGSLLHELTERVVIVVGYTLADDQVFEHFSRTGDQLYFIGHSRPPTHTRWHGLIQGSRSHAELTASGGEEKILRDLIPASSPLPFSSTSARPTSAPQHSPSVHQDSDEGIGDVLVEIVPDDDEVELAAKVDAGLLRITIDDHLKISYQVECPRPAMGNLKIDLGAAPRSLTNMMDLVISALVAYDTATGTERSAQQRRCREVIKDQGQQLYAQIFNRHTEMKTQLDIVDHEVGSDNLTIVFATPREHLSLPFEILHNGVTPMAVSYPLVRQVTGPAARFPQDFDQFVAELVRKKRALRVLLIGSDSGNLPAAKREIAEIESLFKNNHLGLQTKIETLSTPQARVAKVRSVLERCSYHVVHFAGHGIFDPENGEESSLLLDDGRLNVREISHLLQQGDIRFLFANVCSSGAVADGRQLHSQDYLGILDAAVMAKIPTVLGHRWPVVDDRARALATLFYEHLLSGRPVAPEYALLKARQHIYFQAPLDETWLSPVLVTANPFR